MEMELELAEGGVRLAFGSRNTTVVWAIQVRGTAEQRLGCREGCVSGPSGLYAPGSATC